MRRSLVIATTEFLAFLRSKSFLVGLLLPPAMGMLASLASISTQPPRSMPAEYRMVVIDPSGAFTKAIEKATAKRNTETREWGEKGWVLITTRAKLGNRSQDELRRDLADQVQRGEIWGFAEIPPNLTERNDPGPLVRIYAAT